MSKTCSFGEYYSSYDEHALRSSDFYGHVRATITAHKIGFALLCGHPLKAWRAFERRIVLAGHW